MLHLRCDCADVPLEGLALKVLPKLFARLNVAKVAEVFPNSVVVVLLVFVQPHLRSGLSCIELYLRKLYTYIQFNVGPQ